MELADAADASGVTSIENKALLSWHTIGANTTGEIRTFSLVLKKSREPLILSL